MLSSEQHYSRALVELEKMRRTEKPSGAASPTFDLFSSTKVDPEFLARALYHLKSAAKNNHLESMSRFAQLTVFYQNMRKIYDYGYDAGSRARSANGNIAFGWECYERLLAQGIDVCRNFSSTKAIVFDPWTDRECDAFISAMLGPLLMGHPLSDLSREQFAMNPGYRNKLFLAIKQLDNSDLNPSYVKGSPITYCDHCYKRRQKQDQAPSFSPRLATDARMTRLFSRAISLPQLASCSLRIKPKNVTNLYP